MLKKTVIAAYCGLAVFLMSFSTSKTTKSFAKTIVQDQPTEVTWRMLGRMGGSLQVMQNYGDVIKESLQGKKIKISGFVIPLDSKSYVLSKNVYSHCFFCNKNAGIETLMGIQFKNKTPRLKTDAFITLEGTFFYNDKTKDDLIFNIQNAVITNKK